MDVLITGAAGALGQAVATAQGQEHRLRLTDTTDFAVPERAEALQADLLNPDDAWRAVRGMEAIVHTATPPAGLPADGHAHDQAVLEWYTRGCHVLLQAAVQAGVRQCVYLSSLEVFRSYPDDVYISELWRPLPGTAVDEMGRYLGELVCREFARDHRMGNTALRLGRLIREEDAVGQTPDLMWLDPRDAAQACACALRQDSSQEVHGSRRWRVLHVCSEPPHPKYLIDPARRIGFAPEHNFAAHWAAGGS